MKPFSWSFGTLLAMPLGWAIDPGTAIPEPKAPAKAANS